MLKVPHHWAPAEAEAECARLNELGIVDAVWTDDGDALMFGAMVLIKKHREGGNKKSDSLVRVYRMDVIERKHRINRQGLILFALLSGGDYDTKGLEGCGPRAALAAARFDNGRLGQMLYETPLRQLHCVTESLREYFQRPGGRGVYVPPDYPRDLHVKNYREPKVSSEEQARDLRGLKKGWTMPVDEPKLRTFLRGRFDFSTREYIKHILPVALTKALVQTPPEGVGNNLVFEIELVHKRGVDPNDACLKRKIAFSPLVCTDLNLNFHPENGDWEESTNKDGVKFDPTVPVEAELLDCVLQQGLGEIEMQRLKQAAMQPKPQKRKNKDSDANTKSQPVTEASGSTKTPTQAAAKKRKTNLSCDCT